jgi:hypothetical protein
VPPPPSPSQVAPSQPGWCTGEVITPLVFQHGAETAFMVVLPAWLVAGHGASVAPRVW